MWLRESWGKNPKMVWWTNEIKVAVRRKEAAWKEALPASDEEANERCMEEYRKEKRRQRLKGEYIRAKIKSMNSLEGR